MVTFELNHSIVLQVFVFCLDLLNVDYSLESDCCVQVGEVLLELKELLLQHECKLLLRGLVHHLVDNNQGLLFS